MDAKVARAHTLLGKKIFDLIASEANFGKFEVEIECDSLTEQGIINKALRALGYNITEIGKHGLRISW